ncbi:Dipicolinate synthase subunit A [Pelotomaculum schinkii]|uniref:Dipicolinate synthase subunit A n=1 Tax=Pelotomaculum schinkii TaxID=78350 RepID=A0A4Y7RCQ7_9FIRM|nr:dipicolinate synthase subunit DpsA [Pelotomaculum schinkii]TEB06764.1 Dipicolinate synthase subunit A [Pelotomaculum schinkii]
MRPNLKGLKVAVMGGDARDLVIVEELAASGALVNVTGLPAKVKPGVAAFQEQEECLHGINALVLPVPGINEDGLIYAPLADQPLTLTEQLISIMPSNIPVFVGVAGQKLVRLMEQKELRLIELMKIDEVAIYNSIPSAEGAIQMAMEMLPITIHGCTAYVLGFGRTGATLARLLGAMGAKTRVAARRKEPLARIAEMNLTPIPFDQMSKSLREADAIFNTVPSMVLTGEILENVSPEAVIIDLASAPGGTDFQAANKLGIKAVLAPGLPGRVAPKTAGRILARTILGFLAEEMAGR